MSNRDYGFVNLGFPEPSPFLSARFPISFLSTNYLTEESWDFELQKMGNLDQHESET